MSDRLRVIIAEDHFLVREGTRRLLEETGEVEVVATAGTADELLIQVDRQHADAVLTDIRMPPMFQMEGIEAALAIRQRHPRMGVVVLSQHADEVYAVRLLGQGAEGLGYLLKERIGDVMALMHALRETAAGRSAIDPKIVDALIARRSRAEQSPLADLTPREMDVLRLMAEGRSNAAIAAQLFLSESAVDKHIASIFGKLGVGDEPHVNRRVSAVLRFLQAGMLDS